MTPLSRLIPRPRLVTLAGASRPVLPLRLADLATLEAWAAGEAGDPFAGLPAPPDDADPPARRRRLLAAWKSAKGWPPAYGSDAVRDKLATPAGLALFVLACLQRCAPATTPDEALAVASTMTATEWRDLRVAAYGLPAWKELIDEIDPDFHAAGDRRPIDWGEEFEALREKTGWTYEAIGGLTLPEWRNIRSGGRAEEYRARPRPGETAKELMARQKAMFSEGEAAASASSPPPAKGPAPMST